MRLTRQARAVVLISLAAITLAAAAAGQVWPHRTVGVRPMPTARALVVHRDFGLGRTRLYGMLEIDGLTIPALAQLQGDEAGLLHALIAHGAVVERVDPAPWDALFAHAHADVITTSADQFFVFNPDDPGRGLSACPVPADGALIGGGDAPGYAIAVGGDTRVIQFSAPNLAFWRFGEVLVGTPTAHAAEAIAGVLRPVGCASRQ